ncbi:RNA-directed DNA polymerase from mobile element jockey [Trichonephila clavata]|uniref:RNA-directed DNA polymerase from mobile element jockey n=1 Tax=Trichonephila clavata TaxID=2740835 RepID=A0A8X6L143_TRICU|nr:RNA-directed DNA polymerase from mobile element jockey [Trichonephila clavata]
MGISIHAPTEPTRFDARGVNNTLDIALAKGLHAITATSISELISDHIPVNFDISLNNFSSPSLSTCSFPNWTKFQTLLTESIPGNPAISNEDDIEQSIINLNNKIKEAIHTTSTYKAIHHPLQQANTDDNPLYKLFNRNKNKLSHIPPILVPQGLVYNTELKAKVFVTSLENFFIENQDPHDDSTIEEVERTVSGFLTNRVPTRRNHEHYSPTG